MLLYHRINIHFQAQQWPIQFSSVQSLSWIRLFVTPWTAACQASLSITNSRSLLKLMSIELVTPSNHLIFCHPLLFSSSIFASIRVFSNESALCISWPKYWSFSFSISPSSEYSGLISFRMDWLDLLAVHGTLKSLLQHHSSKESILWHSVFFIVQLSHPYMTTGLLWVHQNGQVDQHTAKCLKREFRNRPVNNSSCKDFILTSRRSTYPVNTVYRMFMKKVLSQKGQELGGKTGYESKKISSSSHQHHKEGAEHLHGF